MKRSTMCRLAVLWAVLLNAACSQNPQPQAATPADSTALRARADSIARAERARADSLAVARRDSIARADALTERSRGDSVRAQILENGGSASPATASGLAAAAEAVLFETVLFEYDRADVRPDQAAKLEAKLAILRANPRLEVQIEGHCDERGPDEYNLALGNRRAAAVKRWFVEHGIAEARLTIVSYGEERPAEQASTEDAFARNRRAEFRVTRAAR